MSGKRFREGEPRYMSRGISERLPIEIQMILWGMVDTLCVDPDYLQVFRLEVIGEEADGVRVQVITHSQEVPEYERVYYFPTIREVATGKVYIIDDEDHATMVWADER